MLFNTNIEFLVIKDKKNCDFLSLLPKIHINIKKYKGIIKIKIVRKDILD